MAEFSWLLYSLTVYFQYYMYIYTNKMSPSIRTKVDEFINCEDIALNFLVAHLTKKPPIKVRLFGEFPVVIAKLFCYRHRQFVKLE